MIKALSVINSVCLLIVLLFLSIEIPTFNLSFYSAEYDKYGIPAHINVEKGDLMTVTERLLSYMKGKAPDLTIETNIAGERREFFNQREKDHMVDVKNLILVGFFIRNCAVFIIFTSFIVLALLRVRFLKTYARTVKNVFIGFLIISSILIVSVVLNFEKAFTIFHQLFFNNDLWLLNPDTDLLVNIVPLGFFMDISATIGVIFVVLCLASITLSIVYNRISSTHEAPS